MGEQLTGRKAEILERARRNMTPKQIADDLGVTRNSVYQHITRLRREGYLDEADPRFAGVASHARVDGATDVLAAAEKLVERARARLTEIGAEELRLADERAQVEAFIARNTATHNGAGV